LQFHPKYADPADIRAQQQYWGVDDWTKVVFRFHPEFGQAIPVLGNFATPVSDWRVGWGTKCSACPAGQFKTTQPYTLANPFFGAVDPHGQQLPYLDGAETTMVEDKDVEVFRAMAGESDGPRCCWGAEVLALWHKNMERADISIFGWVAPDGTDALYLWHQDYNADPEWGRLARTLDFRRAMSLAVDRQAINEAVFAGLATVQNNVPHPSKNYYPGDEWAQFEIGPDKDAARALMTKMGYKDANGDGWLDRLDGTGPLELDFRTSGEGDPGGQIGELMKRDFEEIGIKVKLTRPDHWIGPYTDGEIALGGPQDPDREWTNNRAAWYVVRHNVSFSLKSSVYYYRGGEEGWAPTGPDPEFTDVYGNQACEGSYPSDIQCTFIKLQDLHRQGRQLGEFDPRRIEMGKEVYRILVENHYGLNIIGFKPFVGYVRNNVRNWYQESTGRAGYGHNNELHFFEDGIDNVNHPGNRSKKYKSWSFALQ
jgi:peptide/nickel transport system substrate-binding protein